MRIDRNTERCNQCMLCVRDCVAGVWRNIGGEPAVIAPEQCSWCGHCVAVCPRAAITHDALDHRQITPADAEKCDPETYRRIVMERRSIRQYKKTAVPQELIGSILKLAGHSPTASNKQNVAYTVISDAATLKTLSDIVFGFNRKLYERSRIGTGKAVYLVLKALFPDIVRRYLDPMDYYIQEADKGRDYILHGAPALILVHGPKKEPLISENCNIAAANIMNFAHASGLGTCYIGFLTLAMKFSKALRKTARIPGGQKVFAALIMGYPAYRHAFTPSRRLPEIQWIQG